MVLASTPQRRDYPLHFVAKETETQEVEWLEQDHTTGSKRGQDLNPDWADCKALTTRIYWSIREKIKAPDSPVFWLDSSNKHLISTPVCQASWEALEDIVGRRVFALKEHETKVQEMEPIGDLTLSGYLHILSQGFRCKEFIIWEVQDTVGGSGKVRQGTRDGGVSQLVTMVITVGNWSLNHWGAQGQGSWGILHQLPAVVDWGLLLVSIKCSLALWPASSGGQRKPQVKRAGAGTGRPHLHELKGGDANGICTGVGKGPHPFKEQRTAGDTFSLKMHMKCFACSLMGSWSLEPTWGLWQRPLPPVTLPLSPTLTHLPPPGDSEGLQLSTHTGSRTHPDRGGSARALWSQCAGFLSFRAPEQPGSPPQGPSPRTGRSSVIRPLEAGICSCSSQFKPCPWAWSIHACTPWLPYLYAFLQITKHIMHAEEGVTMQQS